MSQASPTIARYQEAFAAIEAQLPGQDQPWLREGRRGALAAFGKLGLPTQREEAWKYTRVAPIERREFSAVELNSSASVDLQALLLQDSLNAHQLVFLDGVYRADLSKQNTLPSGVLICDLRNAFEQHAPLLQSLLQTNAQHKHGFSALNEAFTSDGVLIQLAANVTLNDPIHLLFVASGNADTISHPRIVIDCAKGAHLNVIEQFAAIKESAYFNNVATQISLGEGADVTHYKLQREANTAFHISSMSVQQQANSAFTSHSVNVGAALARHEINLAFNAPDSHCTLNGLYVANGRQHVDYHTHVDHAQPSCTSVQDYRGILAGRSRGVFNACAYVHPHAQKSDATQSNKNLLLSRDVEIDTKPQLEIYADDVKCAHGATVGQLDEKMVFYLRSRGIDEHTARGMLIYGFARDLIDKMPIEQMRDFVTDALFARLPDGEQLRSMLS